MKKGLHKAMPHIPLLKLNPGLAEQIKKDQETTEDTENDDVVKDMKQRDGQRDEGANVSINTACEYDSDISHFNCCLCVKVFLRREYENDEFLLLR